MQFQISYMGKSILKSSVRIENRDRLCWSLKPVSRFPVLRMKRRSVWLTSQSIWQMDVNRAGFSSRSFLSRQPVGARPLTRNANYAIRPSKTLRLISNKRSRYACRRLDASRYPFIEETLYNLAPLTYNRYFIQSSLSFDLETRSHTRAQVAHIVLNALLCDVLLRICVHKYDGLRRRRM